MATIHLFAYIPGLHQGYIDIFNRYKNRLVELWLVDEPLLADHPLSQREIRRIAPVVIAKMLEESGLVSHVTLVDQTNIHLLKDRKIKLISLGDAVTRSVVDTFLNQQKVEYLSPFLRYDEAVVAAARREVEFNGQVSQSALVRKIMALAKTEAVSSSDWFLQVGAVIVRQGRVVASAHNQYQPNEQSAWLLGDPRNFLPYGTDTHQRATIHAEQAAIADCARKGEATADGEIYVTAFPCPDCCQLIAAAGLKKVYFSDGYSSLSSIDVLKTHAVEIINVK